MKERKDEANRLLIAFLKVSKEKGMFVGEWIPVSERLPDKDGEYLVTVDGYIKNHVDLAHWFDSIKDNNGFYKAWKVTAWMPLPKPYKEDTKPKNPIGQTMDFLKNLYLNNKEEIDRVAQEYKVIEEESEVDNG